MSNRPKREAACSAIARWNTDGEVLDAIIEATIEAIKEDNVCGSPVNSGGVDSGDTTKNKTDCPFGKATTGADIVGNQSTDSPTPEPGYQLMPLNDNHIVQTGECYWNTVTQSWDLSAFVSDTAAENCWYERPDPSAPEPEPGYRILPKGDGHVVDEGERTRDYGNTQWLPSARRGQVSDPSCWYERPDPAPEPQAEEREMFGPWKRLSTPKQEQPGWYDPQIIIGNRALELLHHKDYVDEQQRRELR